MSPVGVLLSVRLKLSVRQCVSAWCFLDFVSLSFQFSLDLQLSTNFWNIHVITDQITFITRLIIVGFFEMPLMECIGGIWF